MGFLPENIRAYQFLTVEEFMRFHGELSELPKEGVKKDLKLGDRLEIVPNNATMVINIHEKIYGGEKRSDRKSNPSNGERQW